MMLVRVTLVLGTIGLAVACGVCIGILQRIHPLNEDFEKLTKLMLGLSAAGGLLCAVGAVLHGK